MTAPLPWVKLYTKTIGETEWVDVPADEFGCWAKMLLLAAKSSKRGFIFGTDAAIGSAMHFPEELVTRTVARFSRPPFKTARRLKAGLELVRFVEHYPPSNYVPGHPRGDRPGEQSANAGANGGREREKEEEQRASKEAEAALSILAEVRDFPIEDEQNLAFVSGLFRDYPTIDVLAQIRKWAARKLDDPIRPTSRPRQQIATWMQNALKWGDLKPATATRSLSADERRSQLGLVS